MLKIAIVDDDNACLDQEAAYTARYAKENQLQIETSVFHSGMELLKQLSNRFDIIFLDAALNQILLITCFQCHTQSAYQ